MNIKNWGRSNNTTALHFFQKTAWVKNPLKLKPYWLHKRWLCDTIYVRKCMNAYSFAMSFYPR